MPMLRAAVSLSRIATKARPVGERSRLSVPTMASTSTTETEVVERRLVARHRLPRKLDGLDPHALVAVGHAFPARQDLLDDEGEGDRRDHEVDALQPQRRESDQRADHAGQQPGGQENTPETAR